MSQFDRVPDDIEEFRKAIEFRHYALLLEEMMSWYPGSNIELVFDYSVAVAFARAEGKDLAYWCLNRESEYRTALEALNGKSPSVKVDIVVDVLLRTKVVKFIFGRHETTQSNTLHVDNPLDIDPAELEDSDLPAFQESIRWSQYADTIRALLSQTHHNERILQYPVEFIQRIADSEGLSLKVWLQKQVEAYLHSLNSEEESDYTYMASYLIIESADEHIAQLSFSRKRKRDRRR